MSRSGARCTCKPTFQAWVWSARDKRRLYRTCRTVSEAKAWRSDAQVALRRGELRAPTKQTVEQAAAAWLAGVDAGTTWTRSGLPYKPSVIRSYSSALRRSIIPHFGGYRLGDIRRGDVQDFVHQLAASGLDASTIRNTLMPLRVLYRDAVDRGDVNVNPTIGVRLPRVEGSRDKIVLPDEAAALLAALPAIDRALWATAFYAGLRRGELLALRWEDICLNAGLIRVERSWDEQQGPVSPKSKAGRRTIPMPDILRRVLVEHKLMTGRSDGLIFGRSETSPHSPSNIWRRARRA